MKKELKELRKEIMPLGYRIKTKSLSHGRHATYVHVATGRELTANVFSPEQLKLWQPLFDHLNTISNTTRLEDDGERIYGSKFGKEE